MGANGTLRINLCDYIESWESLSMTLKKSLGQRYQMGCDCKVLLSIYLSIHPSIHPSSRPHCSSPLVFVQVVQCSSIPCSINDPTECLWTDWVLEGTVQGTQAQHYTCIKRNDSSCAWYRGSAPPKKEFMDIEEP